MARVTVEDCITKEENRFELVLLAAHRARALHNGEKSDIPKDNDKAPVVALREIAEEAVPIDKLKEAVIQSNQMYYEDEQIDEELNEKVANYFKNNNFSPEFDYLDISSLGANV